MGKTSNQVFEFISSCKKGKRLSSVTFPVIIPEADPVKLCVQACSSELAVFFRYGDMVSNVAKCNSRHLKNEGEGACNLGKWRRIIHANVLGIESRMQEKYG